MLYHFRRVSCTFLNLLLMAAALDRFSIDLHFGTADFNVVQWCGELYLCQNLSKIIYRVLDMLFILFLLNHATFFITSLMR